MEGTDDDMLWNNSEDGDVRSVRMMAFTVKMESVTLTDKGS